jgi:hypothetical protein
MISRRKVIMLAAALAAFAAGLSWNGGNAVRNGVFSKAEARVGTAHTDELCRGRPEDDAPRGCGWCCGRRGGGSLWPLLRTGRGRLWPGYDALLTAVFRPG